MRTSWGGGLQSRTGNGIVLAHSGAIWTYYGHLAGYWVTVGQSVRGGQVIAPMGSTGESTGPHLHFEVHTGSLESTVDPVPFMTARGIRLGVTPPVDPGINETEELMEFLFSLPSDMASVPAHAGVYIANFSSGEYRHLSSENYSLMQRIGVDSIGAINQRQADLIKAHCARVFSFRGISVQTRPDGSLAPA